MVVFDGDVCLLCIGDKLVLRSAQRKLIDVVGAAIKAVAHDVHARAGRA